MAPTIYPGIVVPVAITYSVTSTTNSLSSLEATTYSVVLFYGYESICTNFDHAPAGLTFTGRARIQGTAYVVDTINGLSLSSIGPAPEVTLTVANAAYDPSSSAALFTMTGSVVDSMYVSFSKTFSLLEFEVGVSAEFATADSCIAAQNTTVLGDGGCPAGGGSGPLTLTRGGICPV
jgi:hypothetical protein